MSANSTECARCGRDKRIPKLYSAANNMIPGPVPPQLQVIPPEYYSESMHYLDKQICILSEYYSESMHYLALVITFLHLLYNIGPCTS